ncbi:MAG: hypothetical protein H6621_01525 [Halobacteriovoraceae bacterium]|nr:hypothetical protein [Halobacteriovoraceae bacterium]
MGIELSIVAVYLCSIFVLAYLSRAKASGESGADLLRHQFLADKTVTFIEAMGSIVATEVSALTFVGIPAFAFGQNFSFINIYFGAVLGRMLIARIVLPQIYDRGYTLYEVMTSRNQSTFGSRRAAALIYFITKVLSIGVRLYAGSVLISEFFRVSIYEAILITSFITFTYTLIGGLKAVVRTDLMQTILFISGGLCAHYLIPDIAGSSWGEMWTMASNAGKTTFFDLYDYHSWGAGIIGGILFDVATHGMDQDYIQRLIACTGIKTAKRAIVCSSFLSIFVGLLFLGVGALLWSFYQIHPLPEGVENDRIFAFFITEHFPPVVRGFLLAGVLAATMSTLDSTINALSCTLFNDIFRRNLKRSIRSSVFWDTLGISILLVLVAFVASNSNGMLVLGLKIQSWSGGALLAIFFTQIHWREKFQMALNGWIILAVYTANVLGVYINSTLLDLPWQFNVYWGCALGMLAVIVARKLTSQEQASKSIEEVN